MAFKKIDTTPDDPLDVPVIVPKTEWWDTAHQHPMSDAQFVEAFCNQTIIYSDDYTIRMVRNRLSRFIRNHMHPAMEAELSRYRKVWK